MTQLDTESTDEHVFFFIKKMNSIGQLRKTASGYEYEGGKSQLK